MQLLTYESGTGMQLGVRTANGVLDVKEAGAAVGVNVASDVHDVIAGGNEALRKLEELVRKAAGRHNLFRKENSLVLGPCVPKPQKILCVGLNYGRHADEVKLARPATPILFSKFSNTLAGSGSTVPMPAGSSQIDYEAELTIVIGRRAKNVPVADALGYVFGYCNANDLSARDLQFRTGQWLLGKTLDGFCPLGPYLVTADEVSNPDNLPIRCWVNGEKRQDSNTSDMIFSCAKLVSYASHYMTLEPGDIILTGTPEGVVAGYAEERRAQYWLRSGDEVSIEVEGLGRLVNRLI